MPEERPVNDIETVSLEFSLDPWSLGAAVWKWQSWPKSCGRAGGEEVGELGGEVEDVGEEGGRGVGGSPRELESTGGAGSRCEWWGCLWSIILRLNSGYCGRKYQVWRGDTL